MYVRALAKVDVLGRDEFATGPLATTDERGRYRIAGLKGLRYQRPPADFFSVVMSYA